VDKNYYKTRLRHKGQITVPSEVRAALGANEGDDLLFSVDEYGRIVVTRAQVIPPDQAWFWNERWQRMEKAAQADIESGNVVEYETAHDAISALDRIETEEDAEN
jgi:AbrB family looped-hinge helix DNA binding protein